MIKLLISGVWVCCVTAGAIYAGAAWKASQPEPVVAKQHMEGLDFRKTKAINVPMVADGSVQGYIITQLAYTVDAKAAKKLPVSPDVFIMDEAFRAIYADDKLDFRHLEKYDLDGLTKRVNQRVNARLQDNMVKDVLVQEFNYLSKADIQAQR